MTKVFWESFLVKTCEPKNLARGELWSRGVDKCQLWLRVLVPQVTPHTSGLHAHSKRSQVYHFSLKILIKPSKSSLSTIFVLQSLVLEIHGYEIQGLGAESSIKKNLKIREVLKCIKSTKNRPKLIIFGKLWQFRVSNSH